MTALPRVKVAHAVFITKELISFLAHAGVVHPGQSPVPFDEFLGGQPTAAIFAFDLSRAKIPSSAIAAMPRIAAHSEV